MFNKIRLAIVRSKPFRVLYTAYGWVLVCGIWAICYALAVIASVGSNRKFEIYSLFCRTAAKVIVKGLGMKVRIEGRENIPNTEPFIFICNHQSHFDIKLVFAFVPRNFCFVSKEEVTKIPILEGYMKVADHVGIPREESRRAYLVLQGLIERAKAGKTLVIFPEGTRSPDGRLQPFKRGIAYVVLKSARSVIPMIILGSRKFLPKGSLLCNPEYREITIRFGKPVSFPLMERVSREDSLLVAEKLKQEVQALLEEREAVCV